MKAFIDRFKLLHGRKPTKKDFLECAMRGLRPPHTTIEVPIHPGLGCANNRYAFYGGKQLSNEYKVFRDMIGLSWDESGASPFHEGPIGIEFRTYWDRRTRKLDFLTGFADVDSTVKGTLDALVNAKCLDTDMRVVEFQAKKFHDKENPRLEIDLWSLPK